MALKIALRSLPPIGSTGLRFGIAAIGVVLWAAITRVSLRPQRGDGRWLIINSALFTAQVAAFTLGVYFGTAAHSVVVCNVCPFQRQQAYDGSASGSTFDSLPAAPRSQRRPRQSPALLTYATGPGSIHLADQRQNHTV